MRLSARIWIGLNGLSMLYLLREAQGQAGCSTACISNGGKCVQEYDSSAYTCDCSGTGGSGPDCAGGTARPPAAANTSSPPSASSSGTYTCPVPCYNGRCSQQENSDSYYCKCNAGFAQPDCQYASSLPAAPPSASSNTSGTYTCPVPCQQGKCKQVLNSDSYMCVCNSGYQGLACDTPSSSSTPPAQAPSRSAGTYTCPVPCEKGQCVQDAGSSYVCKCNTGYQGYACDQAVSPTQAPSPAQCAWCIHGTCQPIANSKGEYFCACNPGYSDWNCNTLKAATSSSSVNNDEHGARTLKGWKIFVIVLICMAGVILIASAAYIVYRRRRGGKSFVKFQDSEFGAQEPQEIEIRRS